MNIWLCDICFLISKGLWEIFTSSHEIKSVGCKKQNCLQNPVILKLPRLFNQLPHGKDRETTVIPASVSFVASRNEEMFYHDNIPTHHHLLFLMLRGIKICLAELFSEVGLDMEVTQMVDIKDSSAAGNSPISKYFCWGNSPINIFKQLEIASVFGGIHSYGYWLLLFQLLNSWQKSVWFLWR